MSARAAYLILCSACEGASPPVDTFALDDGDFLCPECATSERLYAGSEAFRRFLRYSTGRRLRDADTLTERSEAGALLSLVLDRLSIPIHSDL